MGMRGPKPRRKVNIKWSSDFAYAIGLLATDGCVYDSRHVDLTSKDKEQILNFKRALSLDNKIGKKSRATDGVKKYFHIQFGDVVFVEFLRSIGITSAKSKTIGALKVPKQYFFDFLRGCFDGDGSFYSYWDPRWKSSFMHYILFSSASKMFIDWIRGEVDAHLGLRGHVTSNRDKDMWQLKYAKRESRKIIKRMYYSTDIIFLSRKKLKIDKVFAMIGQPKV